jgi:competence protein ComEA
MPSISRTRALAYVAVILIALIIGGKLLLGSTGSTGSSASTAGGDATGLLVADSGAGPEASTASVGAGTPAGEVVVHVAGAVRRPGLYRVRDGARVADAIRRAGGARGRAALDLVNLAAPVVDGQQILVPLRPPRGSALSAADAAASGGSAGAAAPVPLNTATLDDLDGLPGIGPVTAQKILDYRAQHGAFRSIDELDAVSGIGPARMEQLRDLVTL